MNILHLPTEILQYIIGGGFLNNTDIANVAEAVKDRPELVERLRLIPLLKTQITDVFQHDDALPIIDRLSFYELQQLARCAEEYDPWEPDCITIIDRVMCEVLQTVGEKWRDFFDILSLNYVHVSIICFHIFRCQNRLHDANKVLFNEEEINHQRYLTPEYEVDAHLLLKVMAHYMDVYNDYIIKYDGPNYLCHCLIQMAMFNTTLMRPDILKMIIPAYVPFDDAESNFLVECVFQLSYVSFRLFLRNNDDEYLKFKMAVNYFQEQCPAESLLEDNFIDYYISDYDTEEVKIQKYEAWAFYREL
jgi:hypothetical protein